MDLMDDVHVSVLHHIVRAKSVDDYKSSLKYAKFAWIEGTDIDYTVISDFLLRAQEYSTKFQEVMVILDVHTEAENIPPMHAKNRSTKVTLLGCFLDGFPNREGEGRCNTIGWRVYDAANQKLTKKPQDVWRTIEQLSDCLLQEFHEFWRSSLSQMEHMRVLNTRKVLERKLPVYSRDTSGHEKKPTSSPAVARPTFKPNQRRFMDRSGKVYVLGNATPLNRTEETSPVSPRFEELEEETSSVQNEEVFEDLDSQQIPEELDVDDYDPAYLDFFGQLDSKARSDTFGGCYTKFYSADGKCTKSDCSWDHTDKGMRHCLKQTFARCQSSKFFPGVDEFVKMCREPATLQRPKPGMGAPKRT
jgi:hypothetical protein